MIAIDDINQLSLPDLYKETISHMVTRLLDFPAVKDIILFGSCARQDISNYSDIDLAVIVSESLSHEEEWHIDNSIRNWDANIACDVIFLPETVFKREIRGETIIRPILREGVSLNGLLRQRM